MRKFQMLAAAGVAALAAACAGTQTTQSETPSASLASTTSTSSRAAPTPQQRVQTTTPATAPQEATAQPTQQAQATPAPSTTPTTPAGYTDEQLRAFGRAAVDIDPISRTLTSATPEQTTAATEQIRQILARNNIDSATYNAIAAQAQRDPTFAQRIASLNRADPANG